MMMMMTMTVVMKMMMTVMAILSALMVILGTNTSYQRGEWPTIMPGFKAPRAVLRFLTPGPSKIFLLQPLSWVKIFRNGSSGVNIFLQGPSGGQNILAGPIVSQVFLQGLTQVKYSHSQISCALSTASAISLEYMEPHKYSLSTEIWTT